jgi:threonine dehydratase
MTEMEELLGAIGEARARLSTRLQPTPLLLSPSLSARCGRKVFLKLETRQPTGSFKVRPALNAILARLDEARSRGVLASSSGNFAQAVAWAARELGTRAMIVMMGSTSPLKIARTRELGAEVVICGDSFQERWDTTYRLERETGRLMLHPYDSLETIAGDGTLALELLEQHGGGFVALVPTSGGGLFAGTSAVLKPAGASTYGVQPEANGSMARSFAAGVPVQVEPFRTIADSLVALKPGETSFRIARSSAEGVLLVSEEELARAAAHCALQEKLVVEPGGAAGVAALLAGKLPAGSADVVCVLSGGNIGLDRLAEVAGGSG